MSAALLSAALLTLAQSPFSIGIFALFALVPWLRATHYAGRGEAAVLGALVGTTHGCLLGIWGLEALRALGSSSVHAVFGVVTIAAWGKGIPFALLGIAMHSTRERGRGWQVFSAGAAFYIVEIWISNWYMGVPLGLMGHSQLEVGGVAQLALVGGVPLISGLLAAVNMALNVAWNEKGERGALVAPAALFAAWGALVFVGLPVARWARPQPASSPEPPQSILIVQPNLVRAERWLDDHQPLHLKLMVEYTARALGELKRDPGVVIWPENMVTAPVDDSPALASQLQGGVDLLGVPVITGAVRSARSGASDRYRNSVLWLSPGEGVRASIDKVLAVPALETALSGWGEPLAEWAFEGPSRLPQVEEAEFAGPLRADFVVTAILCYEALFPGLVSERTSKDSLAIVNLADDSWIPGDVADSQLLAASAFRAIEQRLTLIRVSHGGLSVVLDPFGIEVASLPPNQFAHMFVSVSKSPPPTLLEKVAILAIPVSVALVVWTSLKARRRRPTAELRQ